MIDFRKIRDDYREELLTNILPFWTEHGFDSMNGGFFGVLGRNGELLSTDKGGWVHGRFTWILSEVYRSIDKNRKWYEYAEHAACFLRDRMRREDGRIYFEVTREGNPLIMRRYLFSEIFASIGFAGFYRITKNEEWLSLARSTLRVIDRLEGALPPKIDPGTRRIESHSSTMIRISLFQILRDADRENEELYSKNITSLIEKISTLFVDEKRQVLLENSGAEGPESRLVNPGHAIETVWFILEEARRNNDTALIQKVLPILDWSLEKGWDSEYGGLFSFIDADKKQPIEIEWDMKYWWPHTEALYACLLAYRLTGRTSYLSWFERIHDYTWTHFPDTDCGEWFGYLHRDCSPASTIKGNHYKGPFHIPRALMLVSKLAGELAAREDLL